MKRAVRIGLILSLALASLILGGPASAHPLGNFTVNLYSGLLVRPGELRVSYVMDMAEIPTYQEMPRIDADGDGSVSPSEGSAYASTKTEELLDGVVAFDGGRRIPLQVESSLISLPQGQAGLPTLRLEAVFAGPIEQTTRIEFQDRNYPDRLGWREITAVGAEGAIVVGSSVPQRSISGGLLRYPSSLLSDPPRVTRAALSVEPGVSSPAPMPDQGAGGDRIGGSAFAGLATWSELSPGVLLVALLLAAAFGAAHALLPGHGKTIMAAYLVGTGGRLRHVVTIGGAVAFMHTASVLGVGLMILAAERFVSPEKIYPWLTLLSGVVVLTLGGGLLAARLRSRSAANDGHGRDHHQHTTPVLSRRGLAALAVSGGILPSPTAVLVLASTVAAHRVAFGLSLILSFSVGLAAALVGMGILVLRARELVFPRLNGGLARLVPVLGAVVIVGAGLYLTGSGLWRL